MSVTRQNRRLADHCRKRLRWLASRTGGVVEERRASGGRIINDYHWSNRRGTRSFRIIWHQSVSDRYFPKTISAEIRRNLRSVSEIFEYEQDEQAETLRTASKANYQIYNTLMGPREINSIVVLMEEISTAERILLSRTVVSPLRKWWFWRSKHREVWF